MVYEPPSDEIERLAKITFDCALKVHRTLGPGLLESVYETCLAYELEKNGLVCQCQAGLPVFYDGLSMDAGLRLDILVENKLIIEVKSVESLLPVHRAQLMTYLKLTKNRL